MGFPVHLPWLILVLAGVAAAVGAESRARAEPASCFNQLSAATRAFGGGTGSSFARDGRGLARLNTPFRRTPEGLQIVEAAVEIGQADVMAPALLHPDFKAALAELRSRGGRVVVNSGELDSAGHLASYTNFSNTVLIRPDTTWSVFKHEVEHFKFDQEVLRHLKSDGILGKAGGHLDPVDDLLEGWAVTDAAHDRGAFDRFMREYASGAKPVDLSTSPTIKRALEFHLQGFSSPVHVSEMVATQAELDLLKPGVLRVLHPNYVDTRLYQLSNQIEDMVSSAADLLTGPQAKQLADLNRQYRTLRAFSWFLKNPGATGVGIGVTVTAGGVGYVLLTDGGKAYEIGK